LNIFFLTNKSLTQMEDIARVFLFDFWGRAEAASGETPAVLAQVQQSFKTRLVLELAATNALRTEATGFRVLSGVLADVPMGMASALKRFTRAYMTPQAVPPPVVRRPPSPELPEDVGDSDDDDERSLSLSFSSSSSSSSSSPPPSSRLSPLHSFSKPHAAFSFSQRGGEAPASIPDYFDADLRELEALRRRREDELEARRASQRRREEMEAIYQRTYEELEREKRREREELLEEQRRLRRGGGGRKRPETPPPPVPPTGGTGGDDAIASVPAFQVDKWAQDGNLMQKLAIQPTTRMEAVPFSSFLHNIADFARRRY
jgi:hypothetical protein